MLDRVLAYVRSVLAGETKGDPALGRYLMDTLGASTEDLEKGSFHSSLQVRRPLSILAVINTSSGYTHDFISCQPCTRPGRSIFATSPCYFMIYCILIQLTRSLLFWQLAFRNIHHLLVPDWTTQVKL